MKYHLFFILCFITSCISSQHYIRFSESDILNTKINESSTQKISANESSIIDLSEAFGNSEIKTDNLVCSIKIIPLETSAQSIFSGIRKSLFSDNRIIILDRKNAILIFDNNGKFISRISQGPGPGEVVQPWDIAFDDKNDHLIVYDATDFLKFYDSDGAFVSETKCPIMFHEFCINEDNYVFYQPEFLNNHLGPEAKYSIIIANRKLEIITKGVSVVKHGLVRREPYMINNGKNIIISPLGNDTIYSVSKSGIQAMYILKYDKYKEKSPDMNIIEQSNKYYHCSGFLENNETQIIHLYNKDGVYFFIRDKNTGKIAGGKSFSADLMFMPLLLPANNVYKGYFVSFIDPNPYIQYKTTEISESDKNILNELSIESNPVIALFKIKEIK